MEFRRVLFRSRFFAGFPVACEVALLIDDKRIVRDRRACPAVVFGQIAPAAFCLDIEEARGAIVRSEEHTSELQSLMRISYAVFCLKKKNTTENIHLTNVLSKTPKTAMCIIHV